MDQGALLRIGGAGAEGGVSGRRLGRAEKLGWAVSLPSTSKQDII